MKTTKLWICGKNPLNSQWELAGVFSTQAKAEQRCRDATHFVAAVELDAEYPDEVMEFPGAYYPLKSSPWSEPEVCRVCGGKGTLDCGDDGAVDPPCDACSAPEGEVWIPHAPGAPMPVPGGVRVRIMTIRNNKSARYLPARFWQQGTSDWWAGATTKAGCIVAYMVEPADPT